MRRSAIVFLVLLLAVLALSLAACGADEASRGPTTTVPGERSSDPVETVEDEADEEGDEEKSDDGNEKKKDHGKDDNDRDD